MSPLIDKLNEVLQKEANLYQQLLKEAEDKRECIIHGKLPQMEQILEREKQLLAVVEGLEQERLPLVEQIRKEHGVTEEPFKLQNLVDRLGEMAAPLAATRKFLKEVLDKLRYRNRLNDELLRASIEHVNSFLRLLHQGINNHATYDRKGRNSGNRSLFDRTA